MTDDQTTENEDESGEPDGFVLIHRPKEEDAMPYGIGPFPPIPGFAEELVKHKMCECDIGVLWVSFPEGIRMQVAASNDALTAAALAVLGEEQGTLPN